MAVIISFGELLWDIFPDYKKPGGSPANLAYHLHALGNQSKLISRVGNDQNGDELLSFLSGKNLPTNYIQTDTEHPTGTVDVTFQQGEPFYNINHPAAWDFIEMENSLRAELKKADAICFASLSQRESGSENTLSRFLETLSGNCLKVFDLNLRPPFYKKETVLKNIRRSDVIKFNREELEEVSGWLNTDDLPRHLLQKDPEKIILVTFGPQGSALLSKEGYTEAKAMPISGTGDSVGVGDAFLASVIHLLLKKTDHSQILKKANMYAAFVASRKGGMPEVPETILTFKKYQEPSQN